MITSSIDGCALTGLHSHPLMNAAASPDALLSPKHTRVSPRAFATSAFLCPESQVTSVQEPGGNRQASRACTALPHCLGVGSPSVNPAIVARKIPYRLEADPMDMETEQSEYRQRKHAR